MNTKNIASLVGMLSRAGFDQSIGHRLLQKVCFKPVSFTLTEKIRKGKDCLTCHLSFQRKTDEWVCEFYDASFIKEIHLPDRTINGIRLQDLDRAMGEISWQVQHSEVAFRLDDEKTWEREKAIENVINDLAKLSASADGKLFADCLKVKYWSDAGLESLVGNLNVIRSRMEVSQRFYFMDGEGIAVDQAWLFLQNRMMEKRLLAQKREDDPRKGADTHTGEGENKKLLQKKRRKRITVAKL